jgi:hypothetical protein
MTRSEIKQFINTNKASKMIKFFSSFFRKEYREVDNMLYHLKNVSYQKRVRITVIEETEELRNGENIELQFEFANGYKKRVGFSYHMSPKSCGLILKDFGSVLEREQF